MDDVTVLRDRLAATPGMTMIDDLSPDMIWFSMDHNVSGRSLFFDLINANSWWILSRKIGQNIKEYKVANYKPSW